MLGYFLGVPEGCPCSSKFPSLQLPLRIFYLSYPSYLTTWVSIRNPSFSSLNRMLSLMLSSSMKTWSSSEEAPGAAEGTSDTEAAEEEASGDPQQEADAGSSEGRKKVKSSNNKMEKTMRSLVQELSKVVSSAVPAKPARFHERDYPQLPEFNGKGRDPHELTHWVTKIKARILLRKVELDSEIALQMA
jgi:hypothetical protein